MRFREVLIKKMRASGRLYLDDESFEALEDGAIDQIVNITCLPGVHRYAIGLPDIHFGYGFPIGGVAAFSEKKRNCISWRSRF